MLFGFSCRNVVRPAAQNSHRRAPKRRRLAFDTLEDRRLLSAYALTAAGPEFQVSGATGVFSPGASQPAASPREAAMDSLGNAAAVWMSPDANGDGNVTLNYQYYANGSGGLTPTTLEGQLATGVVASSAGNWVGFPPIVQVAMAPGSVTTPGDFVVLWQKSAVTPKGTTTFTTEAQVFSPNGPATSPITVGSGSNQAVSVAMNNAGFDVLYDAVKGTSLTATVQRYSASGLAEGSPVSVVPISYDNGSISMDNAGDFVVVWDTSTGAWANPGNYFYIDAQRYNSSGQAQGSVIEVNSPIVPQWPNVQEDSSVSMDPVTGDFVVGWEQWVPDPLNQNGYSVADLYARQFLANGTPVEANSVLTVATATFNTYQWINSPYTPFDEASGGMSANDAIGLAAVPGGAGAFDLAWNNTYETLIPSSTTPSGWQGVGHNNIYAKSYDSSGNQTQWLAVTSDGKSGRPSAAVDGNNDLLVLFNDAGQFDGQLYKPNSQAAGGFVVSAPTNVTAGASFNVTVTATNPDGSANTGYNGILYLAASAASVGSDPSQQGLPASVTLTNGVGSFTVALETAGSQTLTATSTDGSVTASATVSVAPGPAASLELTALGSSDEDGTPITIMVLALDAYGNVDTNYNGTVQLTSTDSTAVFPSSLTPANGVAAFTATFNATTEANYTITATGFTDDPNNPNGSITGKSIGILVYPPPTQPYGHGGKKQ